MVNERTLFMEALEKQTPAERSDFLNAACAGDTTLRQRVEALLQSHAQAGGFMGKPGPQRLAEELAISQDWAETQGESPSDDTGSDALGFLVPCDKPDVLGRLDHYDRRLRPPRRAL